MKTIFQPYKQKVSDALIVVLLLVLGSCANIGIPEGGAKDVEPPKLVESEPANFTTNFDAQNIVITF